MFKEDLLKNKVILVTGGGTGLGKSMATRFGELGANLVIGSRRADVIAKAAQELEQTGAEVLGVKCDVRQMDQVNEMVSAALGKFGRIDILLNNAAGNFISPTEMLSPGGFKAVVDIVLVGTFNCTLAVGKEMIKQKNGNILNIVTTYAWTGSGYVIPSASAKAGVLAMTRSLAVEWAKYNIRSNAIAPGPFPTEGAWKRLVPPGLNIEKKMGRTRNKKNEPRICDIDILDYKGKLIRSHNYSNLIIPHKFLHQRYFIFFSTPTFFLSSIKIFFVGVENKWNVTIFRFMMFSARFGHDRPFSGRPCFPLTFEMRSRYARIPLGDML